MFVVHLIRCDPGVSNIYIYIYIFIFIQYLFFLGGAGVIASFSKVLEVGSSMFFGH